MSPSRSSSNVATLRESATIAVSARAAMLRAAGRPVIDLGAGEPDFPTPAYVMDAARRALDDGATRYTAVPGIAPLREAIAARATVGYHGTEPIERDDVVVSTGSKQALFNTCFTLFGAGNEVLIPTPAWTSYYEIVSLARATPVEVRGSLDRSLKVTPRDLRAVATAKTRGVVINSPCNPTGAVYTPEELAAIARCAHEEGWWVVSDEIYRGITYGAVSLSMLDVATTRERLVVVDGVAKRFAMTGWRVGWAIAPRDVARAISALQSHTTSNTTTLAQHAALAALTNPAGEELALRTMVAAFRHRRDAALALLRASGATVIEPEGAFYLFIRVGNATSSDPEPGTRFAQRLLEEANVAVVPGAAFHAPEWIRVSYAAPEGLVMDGARRIVEGLASIE